MMSRAHGSWANHDHQPPRRAHFDLISIPAVKLDPLPLSHPPRHTAVTNVYRASRDLFLVQRFARHVSPLTTTVYTHPSDQEMFERLRCLPC